MIQTYFEIINSCLHCIIMFLFLIIFLNQPLTKRFKTLSICLGLILIPFISTYISPDFNVGLLCGILLDHLFFFIFSLKHFKIVTQ